MPNFAQCNNYNGNQVSKQLATGSSDVWISSAMKLWEIYHNNCLCRDLVAIAPGPRRKTVARYVC